MALSFIVGENNKMPKDYPPLLAHRGYCDLAPENSQLAFDLVPLFGFGGMELDVHQTADQQLVIIHDETTARTCDQNWQVNLTPYHKLAQLNCAFYFQPQVPKQKILTLKEFLDRYLNHPTIQIINIEIKTDFIHYLGIEKRIHDLVVQYPQAKEKVVFSSFNFTSLKIMHELDPQWKLGFLFYTKRQLQKIDPQVIQQICTYLNPDWKFYANNQKMVLALKKPLCLWTVNSLQKFDHFRQDPNVRLIISNKKF